MSEKPQNKPCMSPLAELLLQDEKPLPLKPKDNRRHGCDSERVLHTNPSRHLGFTEMCFQ